MDNIEILKIGLSKDYNKSLKEILDSINTKNLNEDSELILKMFKINNKIYSKTIESLLYNKDILIEYYKNSVAKLESQKSINIIEIGISTYKKNLILYFIKDEIVEYNYLTNVKNFKEIDYKEYQEENEKSDKESHSSKNISGIKARAFSLENLIYFYIKKIDSLIELPNLIINISYIPNKLNNFLYREFDGVFYNNSDGDIDFINFQFSFPFSKEITFNVNELEKKFNSFFINPFSLIIMEVKMHFPKENDKNKNENLKNVILNLFNKIDLILTLIKKFPYKLKNIHCMLFYDQNKLKNYNIKNIKNYLKDAKKEIDFLFKDYKIFFHILYVFPSISQMSLNLIGSELKEIKNALQQEKTNYDKLKLDFDKEKTNYDKLKLDFDKEKKENDKLKLDFDKEKKENEEKIKALTEAIKKLEEKFDTIEDKKINDEGKEEIKNMEIKKEN